MKDEILSEIAYLDDFDEKRSSATGSLSGDMTEFLRAAIQFEIAKQGHLSDTEQLTSRVASLEAHMALMMRAIARQKGLPTVKYVSTSKALTVVEKVTVTAAKLPRTLVVFYTLGLSCALGFATLLALNAVGINTIHPFLSLLGLIGGLGWLTTAWTDLLVSKQEKLIGNRAVQTKDKNTAAA